MRFHVRLEAKHGLMGSDAHFESTAERAAAKLRKWLAEFEEKEKR